MINLTAGVIIIGNEILSGRTQDTNLKTIADFLTPFGIDIAEARVIPDDEGMIIDTIRSFHQRFTYVFTTGGIGATHDDITAECIAKAFNRAYVNHPKAVEKIRNYYQDSLTDARLSMAKMPEGVTLVENPVSGVPTFFIENVFVLAGMPSVLKGMLTSVAPFLQHGAQTYSNTLTSDVLEGMMAFDLKKIQDDFPDVSIGSYPFYEPNKKGSSIVLRSKDKERLKQATHHVWVMLSTFTLKNTISTQFDIPVECAS